MSKIQVFPAEARAGIAEQIQANASIAYVSPLTTHKYVDVNNLSVAEEFRNRVIAENKNQPDLFYLESVLASIGWNKNDDVFRRMQTWAARNTPEDKPFNYMHRESDIIGHITGTRVVDEFGTEVADDADPPDMFDILTRAVIYSHWEDAEASDRMEKLIAGIEAGEWFVSMECLFSNFDYALRDNDGTLRFISRSEKTAWLSKHLRAYGGSGRYQGYEIGRALDDFYFSGKGLVNQPANPRSLILNKESYKTVSRVADDSSFTLENSDMAELTQKMYDDAVAKATDLEKQIAELTEKVAASKDADYQQKLEAATTEVETLKAQVSDLEEKLEAADKAKSEAEAAKAEVETAKAEVETKLAEAADEMDKMKKEKEMEKRKAELVEAGYADEITEEILGLDEVAFATVVSMAKKFYEEKDDDKKKDDDADAKKGKADEADAGILDDVKSDDVDPAKASDESDTKDDEVHKTQAALVAFANNALGRKTDDN